MESPAYVLLSQQDALERQLQVVANNVANVNTSGYKARGVLFKDFIERPDPKFTHHLVIDGGSYRNTSQGALVKTDNALDLAISGHGYFAVQTPQGTQYTRQGNFQLDAEGNVVTSDGYKVLSGTGGGISIPTDVKEIAIGKDGTISTDKGDVGRLQVVKFTDENAMEETYGGLYTSTETPQVDEGAGLVQGMVEGSNVKPVEEMTRIMDISRAYQQVSKLIDNENERIKNAIRTLGKVA